MQGRLTDLIYSLIEHKDEFIRYHDVQSIIFFGAITAACIVFSFSQWIPGHVGVLFTAIISPGGLFAFYYTKRAHGESLPGKALQAARGRRPGREMLGQGETRFNCQG